ncbi:hypothetical protein FOZ60_017247 [Perkinsus olseni]|uniref:Uncharacterized protein n=1 Tax=Perkinsus olseni TaxID=32597 RepID=A0A7J6P422_PEROL|nr:hypothetical protein FOZ60_017247 [Perkinsus olseni]
MLKVSRSSLGGAGGSSSMAEQLFPGYKDKIWAMIPDEYEGPNGSDYRPGKTFDRLRQLVPFTEEEWSQRQQHRTWDGVKFVMISWAVWMGWKMTQTYPIVWCEEEEEQLVVADDAE